MILLKQGYWVLVADGKKMVFLRNNENTKDYDLRVVWHQSMENPPSREHGTDRPGRANSVPGARRAAVKESDWHQVEETKFAQEVADILDHAAEDGAFEKIVIVAPPKALGDLRAAIKPHTRAKVLAEIPSTLTNHPIEKIEHILKTELDQM